MLPIDYGCALCMERGFIASFPTARAANEHWLDSHYGCVGLFSTEGIVCALGGVQQSDWGAW